MNVICMGLSVAPHGWEGVSGASPGRRGDRRLSLESVIQRARDERRLRRASTSAGRRVGLKDPRRPSCGGRAVPTRGCAREPDRPPASRHPQHHSRSTRRARNAGQLFSRCRFVPRAAPQGSRPAVGGTLSAGVDDSRFGQVGSALDAAHARGLVHRDVKPGTLDRPEVGRGTSITVYLCDFVSPKRHLPHAA